MLKKIAGLLAVVTLVIAPVGLNVYEGNGYLGNPQPSSDDNVNLGSVTSDNVNLGS